eukprot:25715-Amphidinium_carterae.1
MLRVGCSGKHAAHPFNAMVSIAKVEMNIEASRADRDIQKLLDDSRKKKLMPILKDHALENRHLD